MAANWLRRLINVTPLLFIDETSGDASRTELDSSTVKPPRKMPLKFCWAIGPAVLGSVTMTSIADCADTPAGNVTCNFVEERNVAAIGVICPNRTIAPEAKFVPCTVTVAPSVVMALGVTEVTVGAPATPEKSTIARLEEFKSTPVRIVFD